MEWCHEDLGVLITDELKLKCYLNGVNGVSSPNYLDGLLTF